MSYDDYGSYDDGHVVGRSKGDTLWLKPIGSLYARCSQANVWTDASGVLWRLQDMTPIHRQNLISWLERRASGLHQWAFENGKIAYQDRNLTAEEWIATLPLLKALLDLTYCPTCGHAV